ncbi:MAG: hypothetical protein FD134_827 [Gallionellaceae bacterium]|nr:MAG: hypothetical protein FD134_827 [Gallionellaceae bacterium]
MNKVRVSELAAHIAHRSLFFEAYVFLFFLFLLLAPVHAFAWGGSVSGCIANACASASVNANSGGASASGSASVGGSSVSVSASTEDAARNALNVATAPILQTMSALMTGLRDNPPTTEAGWNDLASKMTQVSGQLHNALDGARKAAGTFADSDAFKSMVGLALAADFELYAVGAAASGGNGVEVAGFTPFATLKAMVADAKASTYQSESLALVGLSRGDLVRLSESSRYGAHTIIETEVGGYLASQGNAAAQNFFAKAEAAAEELRLRARQAEEAAARAAAEAEQRAMEDAVRAEEEALAAKREAERLAAQAAKEAADKAKEAERLAAEAAKEAADKAKEAAKVLQALDQIRAAEREFAREVSDLRNALQNATNLSEAEKQRVLGALDEWSRLVGEEVARLTAEVMKNPNAQVALTSLKIMALVVAIAATVIVAGAVVIPLVLLTAVAHTAMTNTSVFEDVPASIIAQATQSTDQAAEAMRSIVAAMVEHGKLGAGEAQQFLATLGQALADKAAEAANIVEEAATAYAQERREEAEKYIADAKAAGKQVADVADEIARDNRTDAKDFRNDLDRIREAGQQKGAAGIGREIGAELGRGPGDFIGQTIGAEKARVALLEEKRRAGDGAGIATVLFGEDSPGEEEAQRRGGQAGKEEGARIGGAIGETIGGAIDKATDWAADKSRGEGTTGQGSQSESESPRRTTDSPPPQQAATIQVWDGSVEVAGRIVRKGESLRVAFDGQLVSGVGSGTPIINAPRPDLVKVAPGLFAEGEFVSGSVSETIAKRFDRYGHGDRNNRDESNSRSSDAPPDGYTETIAARWIHRDNRIRNKARAQES